MGFYESIDFTRESRRDGARGVVIYSYMAHHQAMSLLAIEWLLLDRPMQRRFLSHPVLKAEELLLQERGIFDIPIECDVDGMA